MAITDKTRKILWAKSGNRCAICKTELIMDSDAENKTIVGDECHIISKQTYGPRANPDLSINHDDYENLILLCKIHHTFVDDNPDDYPIDKLKKIKKGHEDWVKEELKRGVIRFNNSSEEKEKIDEYLPRLFSGQQLVRIVQGAHFYDFSNCELQNQDEVELVGAFGEILQDSGDLLDELGVGKKIEIEFTLKNMLEEIEAKGFFVFGSRMRRKLKVGGYIDMWDVAVIRVLRQDDPLILKFNLEKDS